MKNTIGRFAQMALLAVSAMAAVGCSTPEVNAPASYHASSAYEDCLKALVPYNRGSECNSVRSSKADIASFEDFAQGDDEATSEFVSYETTVSAKDAYLNYLSSLDEVTLVELTQQWEELAAAK